MPNETILLRGGELEWIQANCTDKQAITPIIVYVSSVITNLNLMVMKVLNK